MEDNKDSKTTERNKDRQPDAKPINDEKTRHSLGPDLLWEELD